MASDPEGSASPEGAACTQHPEREAQFTCPRCGAFVCAACWHPAIGRCVSCLLRDPTEGAPPIPWEQPGRPLLSRYLATLGQAFSPVRSALAFAQPDVTAAQRFALISAVPFALLAGIIPYTVTLRFKPNLQLQVLGGAGDVEIALDLLRAAGVQLAITSIELLALLLPFVSLVRAYAPGRQHAASCVLYYRLWLLPGTALLLYAAFWLVPMADPKAPGGPALALLLMFELLHKVFAPILLLMAMAATARLCCGLGQGVSLIVVMVPAVLVLIVDALLELGVLQLLPQLATITQG
jgi:hypothetical protein